LLGGVSTVWLQIIQFRLERRTYMGPHDNTGSTTEMLGSNGQLNGSKGKLNVILHGLFIFFQDDEKREISAYIPHMGSVHLYKAGKWFAETTLAEHADLPLQGVATGEAKLRPEHNILLESVQVSDHGHENHSVYATLRLPYPQSIHSLR